MSSIDNTTELDESAGSLPVFVTNRASDLSYVKSVRHDFKDTTPYYSNCKDGKLTRMEYMSVDSRSTAGIRLEAWDCLITGLELLNCPPVKYTLNLNGVNICSSMKTFDFTAMITKNTMLKVHCDMDLKRLQDSGGPCFCDLCDYTEDPVCVPLEPFLNFADKDNIRLCCPKGTVIPRHVKIAATGYHCGASTITTKIMDLHPSDTRVLWMDQPTDYISLTYGPSLTPNVEDIKPRIILKIESFVTTIYPDTDSGLLVIKLSDLGKLTGGAADNYVPDKTNSVNMSRIDSVLLTTLGYDVQSIIQCNYMTYHIPYQDPRILFPSVPSGKNALIPYFR
jgi:hypothetical protein